MDRARRHEADTRAVHAAAWGDHYTPARTALHAALAAEFLNPASKAGPDDVPQAVLAVGAPGAGKSTAVAAWGAARPEGMLAYTVSDPSRVLPLLPEYQGACSNLASNLAAGRGDHSQAHRQLSGSGPGSGVGRNVQKPSLTGR